MDKDFWLASRQWSQQGVSKVLHAGIVLFEDRYDTAMLRNYLARRYLSAPEFAVYEQLPPRRRRSWLNGRVAAKDAVRDYLRQQHGIAVIYPKELRIENNAEGAPMVIPNVSNTVPAGLYVSLAHKAGFAVAIASESPVGIDIEQIKEREEGFINLTVTAAERQVLSQHIAAGDSATAEPVVADSAQDWDEFSVALTRAWVAKESVAKAMGTGLGGAPKSFCVETMQSTEQGMSLCVNNRWVHTQRMSNHIVGWTLPAEPAPLSAPTRKKCNAAITPKLLE